MYTPPHVRVVYTDPLQRADNTHAHTHGDTAQTYGHTDTPHTGTHVHKKHSNSTPRCLTLSSLLNSVGLFLYKQSGTIESDSLEYKDGINSIFLQDWSEGSREK